jgi:hypothetical protein
MHDEKTDWIRTLPENDAFRIDMNKAEHQMTVENKRQWRTTATFRMDVMENVGNRVLLDVLKIH